MRLCHTLVQYRSATAADIEPKSVPEKPVALIGHQCFAVLPTESYIL